MLQVFQAVDFTGVLIGVTRHFPIEQTFHRVEIQIVALAFVSIVFVRSLNLVDNFLRNWQQFLATAGL